MSYCYILINRGPRTVSFYIHKMESLTGFYDCHRRVVFHHINRNYRNKSGWISEAGSLVLTCSYLPNSGWIIRLKKDILWSWKIFCFYTVSAWNLCHFVAELQWLSGVRFGRYHTAKTITSAPLEASFVKHYFSLHTSRRLRWAVYTWGISLKQVSDKHDTYAW